MTLATLAELRASVIDEALRTDAAFLAAFPRFVLFAENRIINGGDAPYMTSPVRVSEMELSTTLTIAAGQVALPAAFLQTVLLYWDTVPVTTPNYEPPAIFRINRSRMTTGSPSKYTIEAGQLLVSPPLATGSLTFVYYQRPAGLVADNDSNVLLTAYPTLYWHAVLFEAYKFIRDNERRDEHLANYKSVVGGIQETDNRKDTGGASLYPRIPRANVRYGY